MNTTTHPATKRTHKLMIRVPMLVHRAIKAQAAEEGVTMNTLLNQKITRWTRDTRAAHHARGIKVDPDFGINEKP